MTADHVVEEARDDEICSTSSMRSRDEGGRRVGVFDLKKGK